MTVQQKPLTIFGDHEQNTIDQINMVLQDERAVAGALCADGHLGYSMPIGGVVAYDNAISPSGVGFDIACGNKAVRTDAVADDLGDIRPWMELIQKNISFGLGRVNNDSVDHELFDNPVWEEIDGPGQPLKQKARAQLGTVGSGNHYVDLLVDDDGFVWVANHFGSRGLGHTIATMGLRWAYGLPDDARNVERDEPAVLDLDTDKGQLYLAAMGLAGEYAYAGRSYVIDKVLSLIGNPHVLLEVHNHHNYAWLENGHWVVRKGATPLTPSPAFIGGSMGDVSVIVRGKLDYHDTRDATGWIQDIGALGSAPHGAGRVMSRTKAAGKFKKVTETRTRPDGTEYTFKKRERDPSTAAVDWSAVKKDLADRGIVVLGSGADEAPEVYKDLMTVIEQHKNIEVLHTLNPIGVVMAGDDVVDPFKD